MRTIAHLIDTTGPGGAETVFTDIVRELPRDRYRSIPILTGPGWLLDRLRADGASPVLVQSAGRSRVAYLSDLVRTLRRIRADIVHGHLIGSAVYGSVAARLAGAKAVCTFHGPADLPEDDRFRKLRFHVINATGARTVFVSQSLRSHVLDLTPLSAARASVIHNGVDAHVFVDTVDSALRAELDIPEDVLLLGALGNVRAPKGYHHLLKAISLLPDHLPPWHLLIAGDTGGEVFPDLQTMRSSLGLDNRVTFAGFRTDVAAVLSSFDVFVLSSVTEGFSLATVQALAAGLPVVATRSGGPEEIIREDVSGLFVKPGDPLELSRALSRVLQDESLRHRLSAAGPAEVRSRFSMGAMIDAYDRLYEGLSG